MSFTLFPNLPKEIRLCIWGYAASIPRVVEVHEDHRDQYFSQFFTFGPEEKHTLMRSKSRPPAILAACSEARSYGLTIYVPAYKECNSQHRGRKAPIYVNPAVDITFRDHTTSYIGDGFKIRCRDWETDKEPLSCTKRLAVDIVALKFPRMQFDSEEMLFRECAEDVLAAARKGLEEVILVVGNTDNLPEVSLVPLEESFENGSIRSTKARECAEKLREATADLIVATTMSPSSNKELDPQDQTLMEEKSQPEKKPSVQMPIIKLMTVQRAPLESFPQFSKLPYELQDMVWKFATEVPRVLEVMALEDEGLFFWVNPRRPALLTTCRASREVMRRTMTHLRLPGSERTMYYNPRIDIVHLPIICDFKRFAKLGIRKVGVSFHGRALDYFGGAEVKKLGNIEQLVILVGNRRGRCEMTINNNLRHPLEAECFSYELRHDIQKTARRWRSYQRARERKGKASPDWNPPLVSVASMDHISETIVPYGYKIKEQASLSLLYLEDSSDECSYWA